MSKGGRLTMAGTNADKPGLSSDRRMKQAAVKPEPEEAQTQLPAFGNLE